jgi:membrane protein DedA with SNARE-associated domain
MVDGRSRAGESRRPWRVRGQVRRRRPPAGAPLAGALGLPRRQFVVGSVLGSAAWAGLLVGLGAAAGSSATALADTLGRIGWTAVAIVVPVVVCIAMARRRSARASLAGA